jgi:hypothetical protein
MSTRKVYVIKERFGGDRIFVFGTKKRAITWVIKNHGDDWEEAYIFDIEFVH